MLVVRFAAVRGVTLCPNYLLSESALALPEHDLYTARELLQMVPVAGRDVWARMLAANAWWRDYLPNAAGTRNAACPDSTPSRLRLAVEWVMHRAPFDHLEAWLLAHKGAELRRGAAPRPCSTRRCARVTSRAGASASAGYRRAREAAHGVSVMSDVLLGHSYFLRFDPKLWRAMQPYPPVGTLYAASMLRDAGHDVRLFDAMLADSTAGWRQMLETQSPAVAVLFEDNFNYLSKMCLLNMRAAAFEMITMARQSGCAVIVCGSDVTDNAAKYLDRGADYAVIGEGEETLVELVGAIARGRGDLLRPYRASNTATPKARSFPRDLRPVLRDLDALPPPARDLVDLGRLRARLAATRPILDEPRRLARLLVSLQLVRQADLGPAPQRPQPRQRRRRDQNAAALGAEHLWFMDDILGIKPGWLEATGRHRRG